MQNSLFLLIFLFSFFRVAIAQLDLKDTTIKVGYSVPSIELTPNLKKAFIKLNSVLKNQLSNKLKNADTLFTIIHIGDSHVQGDFLAAQSANIYKASLEMLDKACCFHTRWQKVMVLEERL